MSAFNRSGHHASALRLVLVSFLSLVLLSACTAPKPGGYRAATAVSVVGVTAKAGLGSAINRNALARDFAELLAQRGEFRVFPAAMLRETVGTPQVSEMLERYARFGQLAQRDVQFLMRAGLASQYAVVARLEEDRVETLPVRREAMTGETGDLLMDRQRVILAKQRITRLSGSVIDLRTGREIWNRHYQVEPVSEVVSTVYHGDSFSGSLAAAFANTVVNGISVSRQPDVPSLQESVRSLLAEVALKIPVR